MENVRCSKRKATAISTQLIVLPANASLSSASMTCAERYDIAKQIRADIPVGMQLQVRSNWRAVDRSIGLDMRRRSAVLLSSLFACVYS